LRYIIGEQMRPTLNLRAQLFVLAFLLVALPGTDSFAQNPDATQEVELTLIPIDSKCRSDFDKPQAINSEDELKALVNKHGRSDCDAANLQIDFEKYTLLAVTIFADCHAWVHLRAVKNAEKKLYQVTVFEKYGGCRGMSLHNRWALVEKLPTGFTVEFKSVSDRK
jgi:hypothetical protein